MITIVVSCVFICLAAGGAAFCFYFMLTRAKESLFAAEREVSRSRVRLEAAKKAARQAEQRYRKLARDLETSMSATGQALDIAASIEEVGRELRDLTTYIFAPLDAPVPQGRHIKEDDALTAQVSPMEIMP